MTLAVTLRGLAHGTGSDLRLLRGSNPWVAPDLRVNDTEVPGSHGVIAGHDLYGGRRVSFRVQANESEWDAAMERVPQVVAAWAPGSADETIEITDDTGDYVLFGRPRQAAPNLENAGAGIVEFDCRFLATDPFIYSAAEHVVGATAPTPSSGLTFPLVFPLVFGPAGTGGTMQITNAGTVPSSRWIAGIGGPCSEPRLSIGGMGIRFAGDLGAGQVLVVDGRARTVLLQGTSTVYGLLSERNWFELPPGDSEVQFTTADNQGGVYFSWRDAWW